MAESEQSRTIEIAAGTADRQVVIELPWQPDMTAIDAVERSGIRDALPELAAAPLVLGRFGRPLDELAVLAPGDRVELCRSLVKDPREMRREVLSAGSVMGRGKPWAD